MSLYAQEPSANREGQLEGQWEQRWEGQWIAEGTLFQIQVAVNGGKLQVSEVESLGFVWLAEPGEIKGNIARIPIEYAGVNGIIEAELLDANTAVAHAASCLPDFMVVCALARDRQAIFRKLGDED
jgi:hypothetical protein